MHRALPALPFACILASTQAPAQQKSEDPFVYINLSVGAGYPYRFGGSLATLIGKRHEVMVGYNHFQRKAPGTPANYRDLGFFSQQNSYPQELFTGLAVTYGYVLLPKRNTDRIRYTLRAGIFFGRYSIPDNFRPISGWGANYDYDIVKESGNAFIINPSFDFTPTTAFGISAGVYGMVSSRYAGGGATFSILLGRVGDHRRPPKPAGYMSRRQKKQMRRQAR